MPFSHFQVLTCSSRLTLGHHPNDDESQLPPYQLPRLNDANQPFDFNARISGQKWKFQFFDTASPVHYTQIHANLIVLCYDISNRNSLNSLPTYWKSLLDTHFNYDEKLPVMVLGLKRDLRREWTPAERAALRGITLMPQEGVEIASQMRCDLYAECSALTGELFKEAAEDMAKLASKTTRPDGGKNEIGGCTVQ
jgi:Ras family protein A